jgi:hypothetical protein
MRSRVQPLLAELHAHTTWSDGELSMRELVDLYGREGFDVLCVTDHVMRSDDPCVDPAEWATRGLTAARWPGYRREIEREAARARSQYDLLLLPGVELSFNDLDPQRAAHAVVIGLEDFVGVDDGLEPGLESARARGTAIIAAHPFDGSSGVPSSRLTRRWACDEGLRSLADRFELFNRQHLFGWVADAGLPAVASGDFHRLAHLTGWKTLLPCARDGSEVVEYLRSPRPVYLARVEAPSTRIAA